MSRSFLFPLVAVAALSIPAPLLAQGTPPVSASEEQLRTELFREGTGLAETGAWKEAAERFRSVIAIRSAPKVLVALAIVEQRLGHLIEARTLLKRAIADARAASNDEDARRAQAELSLLAPKIPILVPKLPADAGRSEIAIDGKTLGPDEREVGVDPGEHTVAVDAAGARSYRGTVKVVAGQRLEFEIPLPAKREAAAAGPAAAEPDGSPPLRLPPLILAGGGVVAAGVGIALWAVGQGQENDVLAACPNGGSSNCPRSLEPEADAAATKMIVGDVFVTVGALAIAGAAVWWFAFPPEDPSKPAAEAKARLRVGVGAGRVTLGGSF